MGISQLQQELTALRNYFNGKKTEIEAAVATAVAAAPTTERNLYVDAVDGMDTNPGTSAAPFRSVDRALVLTASGLLTNIWLRADQVHQLINDHELRYSGVRFRRWGAAGANPVLTPLVTAGAVGDNVSRCLLLSACHVMLSQVDLTMAPKADEGRGWRSYNGFFVVAARDSLGGSFIKVAGENDAPHRRAKLTLVPGQGLVRGRAGLTGVCFDGVETINAGGAGSISHAVMNHGLGAPISVEVYDFVLGANTKIIESIASHPDGYKSLITNYTAASGLI